MTTDWLRGEANFASSAWRATWKSGGGSVLLNPCFHNLDALQWLLGRPASVRGCCQLGRFQQIEVEGRVTAYLEWPNQAIGVFISSTGEAPGANRFEIVGTRDTLILEHGKLLFTRNAMDMLEFGRTARTGFSKPAGRAPGGNPSCQCPRATRRADAEFANAILDCEPLIAPRADGIQAVELANGMVYSSLVKETIALPLDGAAWETKLNQLVAESKREKRVMQVEASGFASSFRK